MSNNQTSSTPADRIALVRTIGAGIRLSDTAVPEIVATLPEGFDPKKHGAVAKAVIAWAVPEGTPVPQQRKGPKGAQVTFDFGRGVDNLTKAVKKALASKDPKPLTLSANLSGGTEDDETGSVTIPTTSPLYGALVALIRSGE